MKVRIGTFSIDFNEEAIRTAKKEAYIRDTAAASPGPDSTRKP